MESNSFNDWSRKKTILKPNSIVTQLKLTSLKTPPYYASVLTQTRGLLSHCGIALCPILVSCLEHAQFPSPRIYVERTSRWRPPY